MDDSVDDDCTTAIRHAQGLGEQASPERVAALTRWLVAELGASAQRLHRVRQALERSRSAGPWGEDAIRLVDGGLALLHSSGVSTEQAEEGFAARLHAEHHPQPRPFAWNRNRRRSLAWWLRRARLPFAGLREETTYRSGTLQRATMHIGRTWVGEVKYFICEQCAIGMIGNIEIAADYQGYGVGQRVIMSLFRRYRTYQWHTTAQYDTSATFWPKMAQLSGASFTFTELCPHMTMRDTARRGN